MSNPPPPTNLKQLKAFLAEDDFGREVAGDLLGPSKCEKKLSEFLTCYEPLIKLKTLIQTKLTKANLPILILGETGTGKELIAEALHGERQGKFVPVNCGGIPSELLESEFFGCIKGAFTGAYYDRQGYVKEAEGGTLFLDEIGDMPPLMQAKILRLLQSKKYRRVGSPTEELANFRLVSATNKSDIENATDFRSDLYYRLAGHTIRLPNLSTRGIEDIKLIINTFAKQDDKIKEKILEDITTINLKGNVRQLLNIIEEHNVLYS